MADPFPTEFTEKCQALLIESHESLKRAKLAIDEHNYRAFHAPWSAFLKNTGGILNLLDAATKKDVRKRQWYGETKRDARKDAFLTYLHQARNAEEHEPTWTSHIQRGAFYFNGGGGTYIVPDGETAFSTDSGGVKISSGMMQSVEGITPSISITKHGPVLKPVKDREGQIYNPPTQFCGRSVSPDDPITIGEIYLAYLEEIVVLALK